MYTPHGKTSQKEDLLKQHASLVKKIAYQLKAKLPASVDIDDLIQAGMMGLLMRPTVMKTTMARNSRPTPPSAYAAP